MTANKNNTVTTEAVHIEVGVKTPFTGYLFTEQYTKDIAQGWQKASRDADSWKNAYIKLQTEVKESTEESKLRLQEAEKAINAAVQKERSARISSSRFNWLLALALGGIAGAVIHNNM